MAATTSFWIHRHFLGIELEPFADDITPTFRFTLINSSGIRFNIQALRAEYESTYYSDGLHNQDRYSTWSIDKISLTTPKQEYINYLGNNVPTWFAVSIPSSFVPISYIAGYQLYLSFPFDLGTSLSSDFNNDGQSDLILANPAAGWSGIWTMNGTSPSGWTTLPWAGGAMPVGAGDFNNDGQSDLILANPAAGWSGIWTMNGTSPSGWTTLPWAGGALPV